MIFARMQKLCVPQRLAWDEAGMVKSTTVPSGASVGVEGFNEYESILKCQAF